MKDLIFHKIEMASRGRINWRSSQARQIIINDIENGVLLEEMTAAEAWEIYRVMPEFSNVSFRQFRERLADHRRQAKKIDWRNSDARQIILCDLESGYLPLDEEELSAEEAWETVYKYMDKFADVPFFQFKEKLADHRAQAQKYHLTSLRDEGALLHDRMLYPQSTHNARGERVFAVSPALSLLRQDIEAGLHERMSSAQLYHHRPEYAAFVQSIFYHRIYQEIRRQKYVNYCKQKKGKYNRPL
jgi:hypothetical protein